ncbi:hypothetical protein IscW_ISCW020811 [Ixodes scapularis]|uniref:Alpha-2-macroglobulin bait region domain-containing protein n=1 Tax=Ixodes scapularis TaxID=6945 RepID=B7PXK9_IXOSC|nr:hypothetical protein IscW_ISCW020811 [Ixodes scapularis]|eukprot:XP_002401148.1 hypothetical protein IscW_ISCW020811 [Ixodes scapularis]
MWYETTLRKSIVTKPRAIDEATFNVTLAKSHNQPAEPGSSQTLVITGTPGTQVGVLGVDQAVYLLRRKDLLTREKVLSRGRILKAEVLEEGQIIERGLKFVVTPEMTPSFRVVTFARIDDHIVSDSIYVSAEPTCSVASQLFQQLDAKDLGCGAGGGTDSVQALHDAGVLLLANTNDDRPKRNACPASSRKWALLEPIGADGQRARDPKVDNANR